jgi:2-dehydro-3-deoxyphosphogluconate aldolase/(4S)-4-hydroxy-2-oxoglutarate aldolase
MRSPRTRLAIYRAILEAGVVPLYYAEDADVAVRIANVCARAGAPVLEFTHRGPEALTTFERLSSDAGLRSTDVSIGAGSVPDAATAAMFLSLGAEFIVTPILDPDIARMCNRRKVAYLPGCATPSEVAAAEELGAEIIKIFPAAQLGGPDFIRAVLAPRPWSHLLPTGGVEPDEDSLRAWFGAGAAAVGLGSALIDRRALRGDAIDELEATVRTTLELARTIRAHR